MPGQTSPAARRNRRPIAEVLSPLLPVQGLVLELASGSGEHARYFAERFPNLTWQPTDAAPEAVQSMAARADEAGLANLRSPLRLDVLRPWPLDAADALVCINMVHISPWECCQALMRGAGRLLPAGGLLYLYGPYNLDGQFTAPSNERFDASLRARNPRWGLREVARVQDEAWLRGLELEQTVQMPANNLSLVFRAVLAVGR